MKLWLSVGTRSVLWGVHQFLWHPLTVGFAWRRLYGVWPDRWEWAAIFFHDLGYVGCTDMDGPSGKDHPEDGAYALSALFYCLGVAGYLRAQTSCELILGHSRSFAEKHRFKVSALCDPDKASILFDPAWFYWLRATLSGEIFEYRRREEARKGLKFSSCWQWLQSYRRAMQSRFTPRLKP